MLQPQVDPSQRRFGWTSGAWPRYPPGETAAAPTPRLPPTQALWRRSSSSRRLRSVAGSPHPARLPRWSCVGTSGYVAIERGERYDVEETVRQLATCQTCGALTTYSSGLSLQLVGKDPLDQGYAGSGISRSFTALSGSVGLRHGLPGSISWGPFHLQPLPYKHAFSAGTLQGCSGGIDLARNDPIQLRSTPDLSIISLDFWRAS